MQLLGILAEAASRPKNGKMVAVPFLPSTSSSLERELWFIKMQEETREPILSFP